MRSDWQARSNNFDFLRLALAVLVIYSHCYPLGTGSEVREPFSVLTHGQMTGGAFAVDLFFVMSGFLITASAERSRSYFGFLKKRAARIYPGFIVSAVLSVLIVLPVSGALMAYSTAAGRVGDFVLQTLRLQEFHYANAFLGNPYAGPINGSVWSIQFEFWCYLGVLLMLSAGLLRRRNMVLALFLLAVAVSVVLPLEGLIFGGKMLGVILGSPQLWERLLPLYLAGVVFYLFRESIPLNRWGALAAIALLVAASWMRLGYMAVFPFAGTYLVFYVAFAPWIKLSGAGRFGDFSYGTYLYAFPIQQLLMKSFGHAVAPALLFVCAAPLTLIAAVASWYGIERRFLQPKRRKETIVHAIETEYVAGQPAVAGRADS